MYLKNITLRGFKSFAKKSHLVFEPGICVIVGPNGSGKSNIADAISWVMGEQSAKSLRGTTMEDVIFRNKNEEYAIAEVSLLFDNTDKFLPLEFNEVKFTRRVFQKGGSEYFLNSSPCRLIDILDITAESGIGKGLYTVVNQGQIDDIALLKPVERKMVIDEILGIAKHKLRREKSKARLIKIKDDIDRINDLMAEVKRTLDPLEIESRKAQAYFDILNNLKEEEISLFIHELNELNAQWDNENKKYDSDNEKIKLLSEQILTVESEKSVFENQHEQMQAVFEKLRTQIEEFNGLMNSIESLLNLSGSKRIIFNAFSNMFNTEYDSISRNTIDTEKKQSLNTEEIQNKRKIIQEKITRISENIDMLGLQISQKIKEPLLLSTLSGIAEILKKEFLVLKELIAEESGTLESDGNIDKSEENSNDGNLPYSVVIMQKLENIETLRKYCEKKFSQASNFYNLLAFIKKNAEKYRTKLLGSLNEILQEINSYNARSNEFLRKISDLTAARQNIDNELFKADFRKEQIKERVKNLTEEILDNYNLSIDYVFKNYSASEDLEKSRKVVRKLKNEIKSFGSVNPNATMEYKRVRERYDFLYSQREDLEDSKKKLEDLIKEINSRIKEMFNSKFEEINANFRLFFKSLFPLGNGEMNLIKENDSDGDDYGIELNVDIGNNKMISLSLLSGGEKALVSIAFLFSIFATNYSPFYVFDEIDASLDEMNLNRFTWLVKKFSEGRQVIIITHQKKTMEIADNIYGVTMQSSGVSKIISEKVSRQDAEVN